jgi:hypothetical protein
MDVFERPDIVPSHLPNPDLGRSDRIVYPVAVEFIRSIIIIIIVVVVWR